MFRFLHRTEAAKNRRRTSISLFYLHTLYMCISYYMCRAKNLIVQVSAKVRSRKRKTFLRTTCNENIVKKSRNWSKYSYSFGVTWNTVWDHLQWKNITRVLIILIHHCRISIEINYDLIFVWISIPNDIQYAWLTRYLLPLSSNNSSFRLDVTLTAYQVLIRHF